MANKTFTKHVLSGSTNGGAIGVNQTSIATTATAVHVAPTGTTGHDEIWLWGSSRATDGNRNVKVYIGGTASTDRIDAIVPQEDGGVLLVPGIPINNALSVRLTATASEGINVYGYVNRITATAT